MPKSVLLQMAEMLPRINIFCCIFHNLVHFIAANVNATDAGNDTVYYTYRCIARYRVFDISFTCVWLNWPQCCGACQFHQKHLIASFLDLILYGPEKDGRHFELLKRRIHIVWLRPEGQKLGLKNIILYFLFAVWHNHNWSPFYMGQACLDSSSRRLSLCTSHVCTDAHGLQHHCSSEEWYPHQRRYAYGDTCGNQNNRVW